MFRAAKAVQAALGQRAFASGDKVVTLFPGARWRVDVEHCHPPAPGGPSVADVRLARRRQLIAICLRIHGSNRSLVAKFRPRRCDVCICLDPRLRAPPLGDRRVPTARSLPPVVACPAVRPARRARLLSSRLLGQERPAAGAWAAPARATPGCAAAHGGDPHRAASLRRRWHRPGDFRVSAARVQGRERPHSMGGAGERAWPRWESPCLPLLQVAPPRARALSRAIKPCHVVNILYRVE